MTPDITCCFTGHRPSRLPWGSHEEDPRCLRLKKQLDSAILQAYEQGYRHFICGMARGADLYFCEAVLALRSLHPEITLEAAIPFLGQADYWPIAERQRWNALLLQCDFETVVQHHYSNGCMDRRNRYMVDHSSLLIAVYDGIPSGGTKNTLLYALKNDLQVSILDVE